jgi:hypothetical protein
MKEQIPTSLGPDSTNFVQARMKGAFPVALLVIGNGKTVSFVTQSGQKKEQRGIFL